MDRQTALAAPVLAQDDFEVLRALAHRHAGIALGPQKRYLLQARLGRRLRALGLASFAAYVRYLTGPDGGAEREDFVNAITTNKTEFFREAHHFRYLADTWAPGVKRRGAAGLRRVRVWSAACSTGEEPYTIAMVLADAVGLPPAWDVRVLASDIDTDAIARAERATYAADQVAAVPPALRARFFVKDAGAAGRLSVRDDLRRLVAFRHINFVDDPWPIRVAFDVIFCRNALIYFDRPGQLEIVRRLTAQLLPGGLLFLGHSESMLGVSGGLRHLGGTIYQKAGDGPMDSRGNR